MSRKIGIVEYEVGDKVRCIHKSDLDIDVTKVDTSAELTVIDTEDIIHESISYQICKVSDGNGTTFFTSVELMPSNEDERKEWDKAKTKLKTKVRTPSESRKPSAARDVDTTMAANAMKGINIKLGKK